MALGVYQSGLLTVPTYINMPSVTHLKFYCILINQYQSLNVCFKGTLTLGVVELNEPC